MWSISFSARPFRRFGIFIKSPNHVEIYWQSHVLILLLTRVDHVTYLGARDRDRDLIRRLIMKWLSREIFGIPRREVIKKKDFWVISHFPGNRDRSLKYAIHDWDTWHAKSRRRRRADRSVQTIEFDCNWVICYPCVASKRLHLRHFNSPVCLSLLYTTSAANDDDNINPHRRLPILSLFFFFFASCCCSVCLCWTCKTCSTGMNNDDGWRRERSFASSSCRLERCFPSFTAQCLSGWVFGGGNKNVKNRKNLRRGREELELSWRN